MRYCGNVVWVLSDEVKFRGKSGGELILTLLLEFASAAYGSGTRN